MSAEYSAPAMFNAKWEGIDHPLLPPPEPPTAEELAERSRVRCNECLAMTGCKWTDGTDKVGFCREGRDSALRESVKPSQRGMERV